ncbi:hypothetical protein DPMN_164884 [Dreissena polymorpha]|uniref:Uncharacterized protein n=1 Tax=Dreissena polymorpha TaxID=45954 RepID=A0A9D4EUE4_DREPO|nr:hypothetical protein DPMN_164884 [Dreissena polymorpha]
MPISLSKHLIPMACIPLSESSVSVMTRGRTQLLTRLVRAAVKMVFSLVSAAMAVRLANVSGA